MARILGDAWHHGPVPDNTEAISSVTLTAATVAEMLNISKATVLSWAKTGRTPAYRVGRSWIMLGAELRVWLESTSTHREPYSEQVGFWGGL
jgi:excisionase family DNA binding protein